MSYVALCSYGLTLQSGRAALKEGELLEVFADLIAKRDFDFGAVAIADVDLHLAVGVNAPLVSQAGHFNVMKESGVFASLVLCVDLLDLREANRAVFLLRPSEGISGLIG